MKHSTINKNFYQNLSTRSIKRILEVLEIIRGRADFEKTKLEIHSHEFGLFFANFGFIDDTFKNIMNALKREGIICTFKKRKNKPLAEIELDITDIIIQLPPINKFYERYNTFHSMLLKILDKRKISKKEMQKNISSKSNTLLLFWRLLTSAISFFRTCRIWLTEFVRLF